MSLRPIISGVVGLFLAVVIGACSGPRLREHKPPILVVWGRNDPSFIAPGAEAFKRDLPESEIHLLDAGHFALDEKNDDIASLVLAFLAKHSV